MCIWSERGREKSYVCMCMWKNECPCQSMHVSEARGNWSGGFKFAETKREREREREYAWRMARELSGYRAQRRKVLFSGFECMCVLPCCFASETWYMVTYRQNLKCIGCVSIDLTNRPHHGLHPQSSGLLQIHVHYICASKY